MNIKRKYGVILTNYTVYRYMLINNIQATSRRKTHGYSKLPHHDIPNLLRRNFTIDRPNIIIFLKRKKYFVIKRIQ